jgi:glutamyl/glutaminyl-tRNA synthetase
MANTRFVPTLSGALHIGHLMTILVNATEAHDSGGRFIMRLDNSQRVWAWKFDENLRGVFKKMVIEDVEWLGIKVDEWSDQDELMPEVIRLAKHLYYDLPPQPFADMPAAHVAGDPTPFYPYVERFTAEHCLMDFLEEVTLVIRAHDLMTEDCFYRHLVDRLKLPRVQLDYVHRLDFTGSEIVSKTAGNFKLCSFRDAGIDPNLLIKRLAIDCLVDPAKGWRFANVKAAPVLGKWAEDAR